MGFLKNDAALGAKIQNRIDQLKNELASLASKSSLVDFNASSNEIASTLNKKGHQAFEWVEEHASDIKNNAKANPKTTLAIILGIGIATYFLLRKK